MNAPNPVVNRLKSHISGRPIVDWYLEYENNDIRLGAEVGDEMYIILTVSDGTLFVHTQDDETLAALGLRPGDAWGHGWRLPKMEDDEGNSDIGYVRVAEEAEEEE